MEDLENIDEIETAVMNMVRNPDPEFVRWLILGLDSPYNELGLETSRGLSPALMDVTALFNNFVDRACGNNDSPPSWDAWEALALHAYNMANKENEASLDTHLINIIEETSNLLNDKESTVVERVLDMAEAMYGKTGRVGAAEIINKKLEM